MKESAFWAHVRKTDTCWLWEGYCARNGYGQAGSCVNGERSVHRIAWISVNGPVPLGMQINHTCDVRHCANPAHLYAGTQADNVADAVQRGRTASGYRNGRYTKPERTARGVRNGRYTKPWRTARGDRSGRRTMPERTARGERVNTAKLTWPLVRQLRTDAQSGLTTEELGAKYGVTPGNVRRIVTGRYWKEGVCAA